MQQVESAADTFPSLVSLYILAKVAKSGIYPPAGLFIYWFAEGDYGGAYGPDGAPFDPGVAGVKVITEVHHKSPDLASPYVGRLKTHLVKVFPIGAGSNEYLGVMTARDAHFDNPYLDMLLHHYVQELRSFYDTREEDAHSRVVDDCQDALFEQTIQKRRDVRSAQVQLEEARLQLETERALAAETASLHREEKKRLEAEVEALRARAGKLMEAVTAASESAESQEAIRLRAALEAIRSDLDAERARSADIEESAKGLRLRIASLDGELAEAGILAGKLRQDLAKSEELCGVVMASRDKFRAMVDGFPIGVIVHHELYTIASLNVAMGNFVLQETLPEAVGNKCYESIGIQTPCPGCPIKTTFEDGEPHEEEIHFTVEGEKRSFRVCGIPVRHPDGRVESVIEYFEDIREKVGIMDQLNRLNQEAEMLKKQIELQSPDTLARLIEKLMRIQQEKKKLEVAVLRSKSLLENLQSSNLEMKQQMRRETDLRHRTSRLVYIARNLESANMEIEDKFKRLCGYIETLAKE